MHVLAGGGEDKHPKIQVRTWHHRLVIWTGRSICQRPIQNFQVAGLDTFIYSQLHRMNAHTTNPYGWNYKAILLANVTVNLWWSQVTELSSPSAEFSSSSHSVRHGFFPSNSVHHGCLPYSMGMLSQPPDLQTQVVFLMAGQDHHFSLQSWYLTAETHDLVSSSCCSIRTTSST